MITIKIDQFGAVPLNFPKKMPQMAMAMAFPLAPPTKLRPAQHHPWG